jgi:hypothetical protein
MDAQRTPGNHLWSLDDLSAEELARLAMEGGAFCWLADEPDIYSDGNLVERFEWRSL